MKNIFYSIICLTALAVFTACGDDDSSGKVTAITVKEAVWVSPAMQLSLKDNATLQLTPYVLPQNATNKNVVYSNRHPELMEVSASGLITAKNIGTDTLTVTAADGSGTFVNYKVVITDHRVKATGITISPASVSLKLGGKTFDLASCVTVTPEDTWDKTVTYTSSNEEVARVSSNGIITSGVEGSAVITVSTTDGSNISKDFIVTVLGLVKKEADIDRSAWSVSTSVLYSDGNNYVTDGTTGKPEDMFDNTAATFLSMVKPGKTYGSYSGTTAGYELYFIVDMKAAKKFNYIRWQHRANNGYPYLRVWVINISGSNDGSDWTLIKQGVAIPNTAGAATGNDANTYHIAIAEDTPDNTVTYEYRYVKVNITGWSDNSGGAASGSTVQIGEFGLGEFYYE